MHWTTIASLATAAGTLVLAVATFASVRSANRAARVAQEALHVRMRPMLITSRLTDPPQKIFFQEGTSFKLDGGQGVAQFDADKGAVYLAMSLRSAGQGIAVIHGWRFTPGRELNPTRPDPESFRVQGLDLLIAAEHIGYWEGAIRDGDPQFGDAAEAVKNRDALTLDLLYGDHDGNQRVITRMMLRHFDPEDPDRRPVWIATVIRHWNLDRPDPRDR